MTTPRIDLMRRHGYSERTLRERAHADPYVRAEAQEELEACEAVIAARGHNACVITNRYAEILRRVLKD